MNRRFFSALIAWLLLLNISLAEAPYMPIQSLYSEADIVCIGKIVEVDSSNKPLATVEVYQTWKGKHQDSIKFRAYPTWTCDTSRAKSGEVKLLMLKREEGGNLGLVNSGQGQISVEKRGGIYYIQVREFDFEFKGENTPMTAFQKMNDFRKLTASQLKDFLQSSI